MNALFNKIGIIIATGFISLASLFGGHVSQVTPSQNVGAAPQYVAAKPTYLFGGGISSSDTSIKLTSLVTPGGAPITTAQLVGSALNVIYGTIEPNTTKKETVSCNAVTQNGDGSATLTGCTRGLQFTTPYTASTTLALSHSGGASFVLSNSPQLYNDIINFVASTSYAGVVDASPTIKGIVEVSTANEAATNKAVGTGDTSAYLVLTSSIASSTRTANTARVVVSSSTDGYIDPSYTNTTQTNNITFSGNTTFSGSVSGLSIVKTIYTASSTGAGVFTIPAGVTNYCAYVTGGGGVGGAGAAASSVGGGGGAGGTAEKCFILSGTTTISYSVGASATASSLVASTTIGTLTLTGNAGSTGGTPQGGAGGTATGGAINITGGQGGTSFSTASNVGFGGSGGASIYGSGGYGAYSGPQAGAAGTSFGSGGGGSLGASGSGATGGAGAQGVIVLTY